MGAAGCAAAPAIASNWIAQFTAGFAANIIANAVDGVLTGVWEAWSDTRQKALQAERDRGFTPLPETCGQETVPALFFGSASGTNSDAATDRLLFCLTSGDPSAKVEFEPWAWQSVYLFAKKISEGKSGDDLAIAQALCGMSLLPNGPIAPYTTTSGKTQVLEYPTRNGLVELTKTIQQDGIAKVRVTANGIASGNGSARSELIDLPTF